MRRSLYYIIALLLGLAVLAIYVYNSRSDMTTVKDADRNFRFSDTAAITRIFIANKEGNSSDLRRTDKGWVVNEKYNCRSEAILNLLEVIKHVEVKMPVPKETRETVIRFMASNALKVEIYTGSKLVRQYYVGHETYDSEASYMLLTDTKTRKNYHEPFACFIPGFKGFLQPRFIANENEWRDRVVMNFIPPDISRIAISYSGQNADSSFSIAIPDPNRFSLYDNDGTPLPFNEAVMRQYLVYFQNLSYEVLITGKNRRLQDSLSMTVPFAVIHVGKKDGTTETFRFFRKAFNGDINPEFGVTFEYDPDRFYMNFAGGKEWALCQYFVFGKLLLNTAYFMPKSSVKK